MSGGRFSQFAAADPEATALVDAQERAYSRGTLAAAANRLSRALRANGLRRGEVLAIAAPNCFEFVATYLAAMQVGLYVVPLNWHLAAPEIRYILENSGAVALVAHERFQQVMLCATSEMDKPPRLLLAIGQIQGYSSIQQFSQHESDGPLEDPQTGRVLSYTSATTGLPKGVSLSLDDADRVLDLAIDRRVALGSALDCHVLLCVSMLYHGAPLEMAYVALHMGHTVVLTDAVAAETILKLIDRYRVTLAYVVPTMFSRLLGLSGAVRTRYSLSTLRKVIHGGAPCRVDIKHRMMEWLGPILWESYGATEGAGTVAAPNEWLTYPGTVGRPIQGTTLKILDDDGRELPAGAVGMIYLCRYAGDRFEYRGDAEKTRAAYRGDLFTVGDIGYVNEDGYLFLCDRRSDMIIRSGMKVYTAEVENALALHSAVADCAVFGIPDEVTGESIVAVVQPAAADVDERRMRADLVGFLTGRVALAKVPTTIIFVPELPRDPTGKLQKRGLRDLYWKPKGLPARMGS